jgi:hypothetical protein
MPIRRLSMIVMLAAAVVSAAGCKGLGNVSGGTGGLSPTASPIPSATPTPPPCNARSTSPDLVVVDMGNQIVPVATASPFGKIGGYAVDADTSGYPTQAQLIDQTAAGGPITTSNVIQFTNIELTSASNHSAVGFSGDAFPATPYEFPGKAGTPQNSTIGNAFWSTGQIPPATNGTLCYSQAFALKKGTYYFGDLNFYNITTFQDVLIVGTPAPGPPPRLRR